MPMASTVVTARAMRKAGRLMPISMAEEDRRCKHGVGLRHHGGGGRGLEQAELRDILLCAWDEGGISWTAIT